MKFKDLIDQYKWDEIYPTLLLLYPDQVENLEGYQHVYETLKSLSPTESDMSIVLINFYDKHTDGYYTDVSGKIGSPVTQNEADVTEITYAIEFTEWSEWLGMEIDTETQSTYPEIEIVAHCLWEMTFCSYTQEEIQQTFEDIKQAREDIGKED